MASSLTLEEFIDLMQAHERIISKVTNQQMVKKERFADFQGEIKSLGAWGGDFILVATHEPKSYVDSYFSKKGLNVVIRFKDIVLCDSLLAQGIDNSDTSLYL